jgi:hypothetical protein
MHEWQHVLERVRSNEREVLNHPLNLIASSCMKRSGQDDAFL